MTDIDIAAFSNDEFEEALHRLIRDRLQSGSMTPSLHPRAVLLGGQSGAGKTTLHAIMRERLGGNAVVVNGDEYRRMHPRYAELDRQFGADAVNHTAAWAGQMTEALVDELSRMKLNLIVEGTLRTSEVPLASARLLKSRNYDVSLALMAVKPQISLVSCQIRFEQMKAAGTIPRATDPAHHDKIVHDIVSNLDVLEKSGVFDEVYLYTRERECLHPRPDDCRSASEILNDVLFGAWTPQEQEHFQALEEQLAQLQQAAGDA